jgi:hypothetical protein
MLLTGALTMKYYPALQPGLFLCSECQNMIKTAWKNRKRKSDIVFNIHFKGKTMKEPWILSGETARS